MIRCKRQAEVAVLLPFKVFNNADPVRVQLQLPDLLVCLQVFDGLDCIAAQV
jgi:hypothetical protein